MRIKQVQEIKDNFDKDILLQAMKEGIPLQSQVEVLESKEQVYTVPVNVYEGSFDNKQDYEATVQALCSDHNDVEARLEILKRNLTSNLEIDIAGYKYAIDNFDVFDLNCDLISTFTYYLKITARIKQECAHKQLNQLKTFICSFDSSETDIIQGYIDSLNDNNQLFKSVLENIDEVSNLLRTASCS